MTVTLPDHMPSSMHGLPRNTAGYPIPFFVARTPDDGGNPDFRYMDSKRWRQALAGRLCWVCGGKLRLREYCFVVGPMCLVNHTTAEPATHPACAEWSARACPFLVNPKKVRREGHRPDEAREAPGVMIERNPGVTALVLTETWKSFRVDNGALIQFGEPKSVEWLREGRPATRAEAEGSIESGLPALLEMAEAEGHAAVADLHALVERAARWLPDE